MAILGDLTKDLQSEYSATPRPYFSLEKDDYVTQVIPSGSSPTGWTNLQGQPVDVKGGTIDGMPAEQVGRMEVGPATAQVGIPQLANQGSSISDETGFAPPSAAPKVGIPRLPVPTGSIFNNPLLKQLTSGLSSVTDKLYEEANKNPLQPGAMTTDQLLKAGYKLGTTTAYDSDIGSYEVPAWIDPKGNAAPFSAYQIQQNDENYQALVRRTEEIQGNFKYFPTDIGYVKMPNPRSGYTRPENVQKSGAFTTQPGAGENVNDFSWGALGKIYDAINSGSYVVTPDKSALITPYGNFGLQPLGNNLYDIPIGAKSGSYNVAIGINDKGQAIFDKNFIDNGAIRYRGGSPGGALSNFVQDIGPVGNIALAVATGGLSIPEQIAAQTAYNMVGGADFEDALTRGALTTGINQGIGYLTGGADLGSTNPADYAGLGSGAGGDYGISSAGALADITPELNVGLASPAAYTPTTGGAPTGGIADLAGAGEGAFPGIQPGTVASDVAQTVGPLPTTEFPLGAGVSDLSELSEPTTGIYPGENVPSGIPEWDNAFIRAGGIFDPEYVNASTGGVELGENVPSGIPAWDDAFVAAGGTFDPAYAVSSDAGIAGLTAADDVAAQQAAANAIVPAGAGAGVADLAGTTAGAGMAGAAGAAGAGIGLADALKYAGLAGLASTLLGGGQTAGGGGGGGPDQTPVGAGLSPDYKPYRYMPYAAGGITALVGGGYNLGGYSDGGRLLRGPGDGVSDDIPASIGGKQPARLADGEFVIPARIVSEIGNGSTDAGARKLYEMMDRVQSARRKTMGKKQFAKDTKADKYFPA